MFSRNRYQQGATSYACNMYIYMHMEKKIINIYIYIYIYIYHKLVLKSSPLHLVVDLWTSLSCDTFFWMLQSNESKVRNDVLLPVDIVKVLT